MALTKVTKSGLADNSVDAAKLVDGTVVAADINDGTITAAKLKLSHFLIQVLQMHN